MLAGHRGKVHRKPLEWLARGATTLALLVLGFVAVTNGLAEVLREHRAASAHAIAPGNARATARLALDLFTAHPDGGRNSTSARLADAALAADPTAVAAVVTLGLQADLRGDRQEAQRLFVYSQQQSRRDLLTQVWAIEDAVRAGKVAAALHHYDIALRTARSAPAVLFPILTNALTEPQIRSALVATLRGKPAWGQPFIAYALANSQSPDALLALFSEMRRAGVGVTPEAAASLINRLVLFGKIDIAWVFYVSVHPGSDRRRSRDPMFNIEPSAASPFDWKVVNSADVSGSLQSGTRGGALLFAVPPNGGGTIAEQLQLLPPGRYRLRGVSTGVDQPERSAPFWALRCRDGRELGRVTVTGSSRSSTPFWGDIDVPADCPVQSLVFIGRSSDLVGGTGGQIDSVILKPR